MRKTDIPALSHYFIRQKTADMNLPDTPRLAPGAMDRLLDYEWPGNVRELQNVIERSLILSGGKPLTFPHLGNPNPERPLPDKEEMTGTREPLDDVVKRHIKNVLALTGGRVEGKDGAAEILGLHHNTLGARMRKLGIPFGRKAMNSTAGSDPHI